MARREQIVFNIAFDDLRSKYQIQPAEKLTAMCKAIGVYTQTNISVKVYRRNGTARFEVIGARIKFTKDQILKEFCKSAGYTRYGMKDQKVKRSSWKAKTKMTIEKQDKILKEGIESRYLLTEATLRKHDLRTGACQLREFGCGPCDHFWWTVVPITKAVSKCSWCKIKYDALPRDKEFGIGRYICQNEGCNNSFYIRCHATQVVTCRNCNNLLRNPYIHPHFYRSKQQRKPLDASIPAFDVPLPSQTAVRQSRQYRPPFQLEQRKPIQSISKKKVVNASSQHVPTGSTISTFLSQSVASELEVPLADPDSDSDEEVILHRDSDSSDDDTSDIDTASTTSDSTSSRMYPDTEQGTAPYSSSSSSDSDSDHGGSRDHRRLIATDSSDSGSGSDDENDRDGSDKMSQEASCLDSGLGTLSNTDDTSSLSSPLSLSQIASSQVSSESFKPLQMIEVKRDYPGIKFSKQCAHKVVDHEGAFLQGEGIKVEIPPKAIRVGDPIPISLQACVQGPFKFPRDYTLASPVYLLYPPCVFHEQVTLTADLFAHLQTKDDCDDIVFAISPDKPYVRMEKGDAIWKFQLDEGVAIKCQPETGQVTVELNHFCLGALLRRSRSNQSDRYLISVYTPKVLLQTCHAIFGASLFHEVYSDKLQEYVDKEFSDEAFYNQSQIIHLSESEIAINIEQEDHDYDIHPIKKPCKITKEDINMAKKCKRQARRGVAYPPRIVWRIQHKTGMDMPFLKCLFKLSGIRENLSFPINLFPSSSLSQHTDSIDNSGSSQSSLRTQHSFTVDQLIQKQKIDISKESLDQKCSEENLMKIGSLIGNWLQYAHQLGLTEAEILEIKVDSHLEDKMKAQKVLRRWHKKNYFMATYKRLIDVCLALDDEKLVNEIFKLLKGPRQSEV